MCSAFVSGSEIAFFSLSPNDLNEIKLEKHRSDKIINKIKAEQQEYFLATVLILNNFINVAIVILSSFVSQNLIDFGHADTLNFIFQSIIITFLLLLFGEIMPKVYCSSNPLKITRFGIRIIAFFIKIFYPLSVILVKSTSITNKRLAKHAHNNLSIDELSEAVDLTTDGNKEDKEILEGIVNFGSINVKEIMTSRIDMISIDLSDSYKNVIKTIIDSAYSRIPVCDKSEDNIKGILYSKDLLPHIDEKDDFKWQELIRPAFFVPETKKIDDLLNEFQQGKKHIAIVVDEFGGTSGIITMEDILEEIIGDINDEHDDTEVLYKKLNANTYMLDGKLLLNDFYKIEEINEEDFAEFTEPETIAGLLLEIKGEFPIKNEVVIYKNYKFEVTSLSKRRIEKIKLIL